MPQLSEGRKVTYYLGLVLMVAGLLVFGSVFVTGALQFGDFTDFQDRSRSSALRAVVGMALLLLGGVLRTVGARGVAGSGLVLDPKRARRDLEPYSRMGGGMLRDALDEVGDVLPGTQRGGEKVVMVKCRACGKLNEEDSKFCQECGQAI